MVRSFGSFDEWLEAKKLLPPLERPQMDAALAGDARLGAECQEVRGQGQGLHAVCSSKLHGQQHAARAQTAHTACVVLK